MRLCLGCFILLLADWDGLLTRSRSLSLLADAKKTTTKSPTREPTANPSSSNSKTLTALIYADNYFEFYVNGELTKKDPIAFTPHQASRFEYTVDLDDADEVTYAIKAKDWADVVTGYEYMNAVKGLAIPAIGGGGLRVLLGDGTVSSADWKCFTTSFGPTDESIEDGCSIQDFDSCAITNTTEPDGWQQVGFDDSDWSSATIYSEDEVGWGRTPSYDDDAQACRTLTDPTTGEDKDPSYMVMDEDDCLDPSAQDWGESSFIWKEDLDRDNTILCRMVVSMDATGEKGEEDKDDHEDEEDTDTDTDDQDDQDATEGDTDVQISSAPSPSPTENIGVITDIDTGTFDSLISWNTGWHLLEILAFNVTC
jgi:hypothetical protein